MVKQKQEEIKDADVKEQFDKNVEEELGGTDSESSTEKEPSPASSAEDVKSVTGEKKQEKSESVPYSRFKEVDDKANKTEEDINDFLTRHGDKVRRIPETGKLELFTKDKSEEEAEPKLTEEDMLAFDDTQIKVIDKILSIRERQVSKRWEEQRRHQEDSSVNWNKATEEFPEVKDVKSELYKKANEILVNKYSVFNKQGQVIYIDPKGHYLSVLEADRVIRKGKEQKEKEIKEEKKNDAQKTFVSRSSTREPVKSKGSEKDIDEMSSSEIDDQMETEFNDNIEKLNA